MFGGATSYVETLDGVLEFVESGGPSTDELVKWYRKRFKEVSSRGSIMRNVGYLQTVGFLERRGDRWEVGPQGREYRSSDDMDTLVRIMCNRNVGLWSLMTALTDGKMTIEAINDQQLSTHDELGWDPNRTIMAKQRTNWLISMGQIERQTDGYAITDDGRSFLRKQEPPAEAPKRIMRGQAIGDHKDANENGAGEAPEVASKEHSPAKVALTAELQELHKNLDRPLHPTDLATHGGAGAAAYAEQFESWEQAGKAAHVSASTPRWKEAVLRELRLYRGRQADPIAKLDDLYVAMKDRLGLLYPKNNNIRPKIHQQLQYLEEENEVEFTENLGVYELKCDPLPVEIEETDLASISSMTTELTDVEDLAVSCSRLETVCETLEERLRVDSEQFQSELVQAQKNLEDIRRRLREVRQRTQTAEAILSGDLSPELALERTSPSGPTKEICAAEDLSMLNYLRELADRFGESPQAETVEYCGEYGVELYLEEFGSWSETIEAAGLEPINKIKRGLRQHKRIHALKSLKKTEADLGRAPSRAEMDHRGTVPVKEVTALLGGWNSALDLLSSIVEKPPTTTQSSPDSTETQGPSEIETVESPSEPESEEGDVDILAEIEQTLSEL
jgi:uncharacterized protein YukE/ribosomal protein S19E (S16A)